jgi:hypothetical protein
MNDTLVMGPVGVHDSFTSSRPPRFGDPLNENYPSYRRDVELWLRLTEVSKSKQGVALVGCLSGEPKEFAKTLSDELLFSDDSGNNVLIHLDKAYQDSTEMILNSRVSAFLDYQRLPSMSISTYIAGFYARLDNLTQLQMPDDLKGHLLLKQANLEQSEKTMVIASAKGSHKVKDLVDSMRQLYGDRQDVPVASPTFTVPSFTTVKKTKKFCTYCKKKNHLEADCWKKRKDNEQNMIDNKPSAPSGPVNNTYFTYFSGQPDEFKLCGLIDSGAVHTVIGAATLDVMMKRYNISRIEKCPPLSIVHRFGNNGTPMEPEFGAIIPWTVRDVYNKDHCFNLRADVLDGDHPLLIGFPTLVAMKASVDFETLEMKTTINSSVCVLKLSRKGNHIFIGHTPTIPINSTQNVISAPDDDTFYYGISFSGMSQYFQQPDHC